MTLVLWHTICVICWPKPQTPKHLLFDKGTGPAQPPLQFRPVWALIPISVTTLSPKNPSQSCSIFLILSWGASGAREGSLKISGRNLKSTEITQKRNCAKQKGEKLCHQASLAVQTLPQSRAMMKFSLWDTNGNQYDEGEAPVLWREQVFTMGKWGRRRRAFEKSKVREEWLWLQALEESLQVCVCACACQRTEKKEAFTVFIVTMSRKGHNAKWLY